MSSGRENSAWAVVGLTQLLRLGKRLSSWSPRQELRIFQASTYDDDRYFIKLSDVEHSLGENESALPHARKASAEEPEERYWPRGYLPSTIVGAILWSADRSAAENALRLSEEI